jgi:hypothetical protein
MEIIEISTADIKVNPEYEALAPELKKEQYAELKADIELYQIKYPILINDDNEVIDGHNRYKVAKELKISKVPTICRSYNSKLEESRDVIILNLNRRQFNKFELYLIAEKLLPIEEGLSKQRIKDTLPGKGTKGTSKPKGDKRGETIEIVASATGLKRTQVNQIKNISKAAGSNPKIAELWTNFKNGNSKDSISSIHKMVKEKGDEKSGVETENKPEETPNGENLISGSESEIPEVEVPVITTVEGDKPSTLVPELEIEPENFGSSLEITDEEAEADPVDYTEDKRGEDIEITFNVSADVKKRLNFLKKCSTLKGKPIETYNSAIRLALKRAKLWDFPEFEK